VVVGDRHQHSHRPQWPSYCSETGSGTPAVKKEEAFSSDFDFDSDDNDGDDGDDADNTNITLDFSAFDRR
jgi:hypothetical protein